MGVCFAAFAQQYRWTDENGRVQYGDTPPPGVKATPLRAPATPPAAPAAKAPTAAEKEAAARKRQQEAGKASEKQAVADKNAEIKKQNCATAQDAVRILSQGRVRRIDSKGEFVYLDDNQINDEMAKAKKSVAEWCG
jgi:hypothetical protein